MSGTCTVTETSEFQLVNIITIAEDRLQSNFIKIINRLNQHEQLIHENKLYAQKNQQSLLTLRSFMDDKFEKTKESVEASSARVQTEIEEIKATIEEERMRIDENFKISAQLKERQDVLKGELIEEVNARQYHIEDLTEEIKKVKIEMNSISNALDSKENMVEVQKIRKQIGDLRAIIEKIEQQQKFNEYKLQKMEILNQKADKAQKSKQAQLIKEMQEKIKNQLKASSSKAQIIQKENLVEKKEKVVEEEKRASFFFSNPSQATNQKLVSQMSDKISSFESKLANIEERLKKLGNVQESGGKESKTLIIEKIHQMKPEMIKIWGKCDQLDDKTMYIERKVDQQGKILQHIVDVQKESHFSKIEDKIKNFQTEFYASLKQIKTKVDSKTNNSDFEKVIKNINDRILTIMEQLILKSDKIEVKKALLFLESKIKEIILVISEDEENERDALITKKQIKCISCDKDVDKFLGTTSNLKGNWDALPYKEHSPEVLGRFGMTNYGSLARKVKKLDGKDLPMLSGKKSKEFTQSEHRNNS